MDLPSCRLEKMCFRLNAYAASREVSCFIIQYLFMAMPPLKSQDLQPLHLELHSAGEDAAAYSVHTAELPAPLFMVTRMLLTACESELVLWQHQDIQRCAGIWPLIRCSEIRHDK
jgi:hypothetical protein